MSAHKVHFSSATDNWRTPAAFYKALDAEFNFDFDPCPLTQSPKFNGLEVEWGKRTFCNPPYSDLRDWMRKAYAEHLKGKTVVMLIPSRTDTIAWHDYALKASEIRFIRGRLTFGNAKHGAPFPSAIVIFRAASMTFASPETTEGGVG